MSNEDEFDELFKKYKEVFGSYYPIGFGNNVTDDEAIADMKKAIETGKKFKCKKPPAGVNF